jgi:hypothetical protein
MLYRKGKCAELKESERAPIERNVIRKKSLSPANPG